MDIRSIPERVNSLELKLGLKEKTHVELFYASPCPKYFKNIPLEDLNPAIIEFAMENVWNAVSMIPESMLTAELCEKALRKNYRSLKLLPQKILNKASYLYDIALEIDGRAIYYIPPEKITKERLLLAVRHKVSINNDTEKYPIYYIPKIIYGINTMSESIRYSPLSIRDIPEEKLTDILCLLAVTLDGMALKFVPPKFKNSKVLSAAVASAPLSLEFIPPSKRSKKLCVTAFEADPRSIKWIPVKHITGEMCMTLIEKEQSCSFQWLPSDLLNDRSILEKLIGSEGILLLSKWEKENVDKTGLCGSEVSEKNNETIIEMQKADMEWQLFIDEEELLPVSSDSFVLETVSTEPYRYDLAENENGVRNIYYISDIHLENQLETVLEDSTTDADIINSFLDKKISEMLFTTGGLQSNDYLLIGGDVGHTNWLVYEFYRKLSIAWHGTLIAVLGNHELWDGHKEIDYESKPLDVIINEYRKRINSYKRKLLQNDVYVNYKNGKEVVISEETILNSSESDLKEVFEKSPIIILGGIGFSGLNPKFNAEYKLYRSAVNNNEEDLALSTRFKAVYDKINSCAGDRQVIVLTHNPVRDWSAEPYNPKWAYINGHTHINSLIRRKDGTTVLSDNQVGKKPIKWKLNAFTISGWYDPFSDLPDGIHTISSEQYQEFNRGRGIKNDGVKFPGTIYMLKRKELYMFLLESKTSLCILNGGNRKRLSSFDIGYYYDNMVLYASRVKLIFSPFQNTLKIISEEVKQFGGFGTIHGCIVDITFLDHIYLNPYDGKITPYFAYDMIEKYVYDSVLSLLQNELPNWVERYLDAQKKGKIPFLSRYALEDSRNSKNAPSNTSPKRVSETDIYKSSRVAKAFQYIMNDNVVRIWNDSILAEPNDNLLTPAFILDEFLDK